MLGQNKGVATHLQHFIIFLLRKDLTNDYVCNTKLSFYWLAAKALRFALILLLFIQLLLLLSCNISVLFT